MILPPAWEEEWHFVPIDDPESYRDPGDNKLPDQEWEWFPESALPQSVMDRERPWSNGIPTLPEDVPAIGGQGDSSFPGAPHHSGWTSLMPPPDAFAFYLPFHFFYPRAWGIYIVLENALELAEYVRWHSGGRLTLAEALTVVRIFLYAHEAFHHLVECFATRLEITHRKPTYKDGFSDYFNRVFGTDDCVEEALASAHGYRRVKDKFSKGDLRKKTAALNALDDFTRGGPPGYRRAYEFFKTGAFEKQRNMLAELNQRECFGDPKKAAALWACFPHAFSGISRVTSRVNYVVRRGSPLATRLSLELRYLSYRELKEN